jgi:hypothetical protein
METPKIPTPHDKQDGDEALSFDPTTPPAQVDIHGFARRAGEIMARGGVLCWGDASDEDRKQTPCAENRPPARQLRELRSLRCVFAIDRAKTRMQRLRDGKYGDTVEIARRLRTDRQAFRRLALDNPLVIELCEWSRMHDELKQEQSRLANRVGDQLWRYYPQVSEDDPAVLLDLDYWALMPR